MSQTVAETNIENTHLLVYIYHGRDGEVVPKDVTNVVIHSSVKRVLSQAFEDCERLESIKLHKGVTSIGSHAFRNCVHLTYINLHESSVEIIDQFAFFGCHSLKGVEFPPLLENDL